MQFTSALSPPVHADSPYLVAPPVVDEEPTPPTKSSPDTPTNGETTSPETDTSDTEATPGGSSGSSEEPSKEESGAADSDASAPSPVAVASPVSSSREFDVSAIQIGKSDVSSAVAQQAESSGSSKSNRKAVIAVIVVASVMMVVAAAVGVALFIRSRMGDSGNNTMRLVCSSFFPSYSFSCSIKCAEIHCQF